MVLRVTVHSILTSDWPLGFSENALYAYYLPFIEFSIDDCTADSTSCYSLSCLWHTIILMSSLDLYWGRRHRGKGEGEGQRKQNNNSYSLLFHWYCFWPARTQVFICIHLRHVMHIFADAAVVSMRIHFLFDSIFHREEELKVTGWEREREREREASLVEGQSWWEVSS